MLQNNMWMLGIVAALLVGCTTEPESTESTTNGKFSVQVLGTDKNGYTIHRFRDAGRLHYYVTPGPARTMSYHSESSGKSSVDHFDTVDTK